jgi:hypothetical protein
VLLCVVRSGGALRRSDGVFAPCCCVCVQIVFQPGNWKTFSPMMRGLRPIDRARELSRLRAAALLTPRVRSSVRADDFTLFDEYTFTPPPAHLKQGKFPVPMQVRRSRAHRAAVVDAARCRVATPAAACRVVTPAAARRLAATQPRRGRHTTAPPLLPPPRAPHAPRVAVAAQTYYFVNDKRCKEKHLKLWSNFTDVPEKFVCEQLEGNHLFFYDVPGAPSHCGPDPDLTLAPAHLFDDVPRKRTSEPQHQPEPDQNPVLTLIALTLTLRPRLPMLSRWRRPMLRVGSLRPPARAAYMEKVISRLPF